MNAARARFLTQGVDGASLREIAKAARTSVGMVSYYFPTKDDLFLAVLEHAYPRLLTGVRSALARPLPAQERIASGYARLHAMDEEEFAVVRILLREALVSSSRLEKLFQRFTAEGGHVPMVREALAQGVVAGAIRDDLPPAAVVVAIMALGMGPVLARRRVSSLRRRAELPSAEESARMMAQVLFEGIGAGPHTPTVTRSRARVRRR